MNWLWKMPTRSSTVASKILMQTPEPLSDFARTCSCFDGNSHPHTMNIYHKRAIFRRRDESNVYRMFFWVILILGGIWLIRSVQQGDVKPLFLPTATPTRFAESYAA